MDEVTEHLKALFQEPGWRILMSNAQAEVDNIMLQLTETDTWEQTLRLQGQLQQLATLLNLELMLTANEEEDDADL